MAFGSLGERTFRRSGYEVLSRPKNGAWPPDSHAVSATRYPLDTARLGDGTVRDFKVRLFCNVGSRSAWSDVVTEPAEKVGDH